MMREEALDIVDDRPDALHVFCYATRPFLIEYAIAHRGVSTAHADQEVDKRNKQREQYVKRHFNRDWRSFDNYHVCVDTGRLGIETAADVVIYAARERFNLR